MGTVRTDKCCNLTKRNKISQGIVDFIPFQFVLYFSKLGFAIAWIVLIILAYRVSLIEIEHKEYDPFAVLDIDRVNFYNISKKKQKSCVFF